MWICIPPSSLALICNAVRCNNFIAQCDNFNAQCDNFIAHCDNFNAQCDTMHCNRTVHTDSWPTWTMQPNVFPAASSALHSTEKFLFCQYIPHTHLASIRPTALSSSSHFFPPTRCNMVMGHPHAAKTARSTNTERADAFDRQYLAETFLQCDPSV